MRRETGLLGWLGWSSGEGYDEPRSRPQRCRGCVDTDRVRYRAKDRSDSRSGRSIATCRSIMRSIRLVVPAGDIVHVP